MPNGVVSATAHAGARPAPPPATACLVSGTQSYVCTEDIAANQPGCEMFSQIRVLSAAGVVGVACRDRWNSVW
eukprot:350500-Chlamydomonas_euryale.AAC.23